MSTVVQAQSKLERAFQVPDSLHHKRLLGVSVGQGLIWGSSMYALNRTWYSNYPKSRFHFYNDSQEWLQVDKIGHGWSAYFGAQFSSALFRWAGVKPKRASLYGAGMGIAYVTVIEILDGFSSEWGFSVGDIAANTFGAALFSGQEYAWGEQRIQYKFSSHIRKYPSIELQQRANNLFGKTTPEKILKDYNHQTYWLSVNVWSFAKQSSWPKWLNLAIGYGANHVYGGYENYGFDKVTKRPYDFSYLPRTRQYYFSPDIDLSKIEFRGRKLKVLKALHFLKLKFPLPTLEFNSEGGWAFHPLYF